jgi:hypothetical protein
MRQLVSDRKYIGTHRKLVKPNTIERAANFASNLYAPVQVRELKPDLWPWLH